MGTEFEKSGGSYGTVHFVLVMLGALLGILGLYGKFNHWSPPISIMMETWLIVFLLMIAVSYFGVKMAIFFADKPRVSTFLYILSMGFLSVLVDSFAVALFGNRVEMRPVEGTEYSFDWCKYNVRHAGVFCALVVGVLLWTGELWGLPHFLHSGFTDIYVGLPFALVVVPTALAIAVYTSTKYPVQLIARPLSSRDIMSLLGFVSVLLALILTHDVILPFGVLLIIVGVSKGERDLIVNTWHEIAHQRGWIALALVGIPVLLQMLLPTVLTQIQGLVKSWGIILASSVSSPLASAIMSPAIDPSQLYWNISFLMIGATLFAWSSIVGIMIFKEEIDFEDIPSRWQPFFKFVPAIRGHNLVTELILYPVTTARFAIPLLVLLVVANKLNLFATIYSFLID